MKVKKTLIDMIIKWHQAGYSLDEIAPRCRKSPKRKSKRSSNNTTSNKKPDLPAGLLASPQTRLHRRRESNK